MYIIEKNMIFYLYFYMKYVYCLCVFVYVYLGFFEPLIGRTKCVFDARART